MLDNCEGFVYVDRYRSKHACSRQPQCKLLFEPVHLFWTDKIWAWTVRLWSWFSWALLASSRFQIRPGKHIFSMRFHILALSSAASLCLTWVPKRTAASVVSVSVHGPSTFGTWCVKTSDAMVNIMEYHGIMTSEFWVFFSLRWSLTIPCRSSRCCLRSLFSVRKLARRSLLADEACLFSNIQACFSKRWGDARPYWPYWPYCFVFEALARQLGWIHWLLAPRRGQTSNVVYVPFPFPLRPPNPFRGTCCTGWSVSIPRIVFNPTAATFQPQSLVLLLSACCFDTWRTWRVGQKIDFNTLQLYPWHSFEWCWWSFMVIRFFERMLENLEFGWFSPEFLISESQAMLDIFNKKYTATETVTSMLFYGALSTAAIAVETWGKGSREAHEVFFHHSSAIDIIWLIFILHLDFITTYPLWTDPCRKYILSALWDEGSESNSSLGTSYQQPVCLDWLPGCWGQLSPASWWTIIHIGKFNCHNQILWENVWKCEIFSDIARIACNTEQ